MTANNNTGKLIDYLEEKIKELNLVYALSKGLTKEEKLELKKRIEDEENLDLLITLTYDEGVN